jgi:2,3,4,5-tetrahydropyridine-2-carboxylate N-succinyltransferase
MNMTALQARIEALWGRRDQLSPTTTGADRASVEEALEMLDSGQARVAEPDGNGGWKVNQWLKQAVLMSFRLADSAPMDVSTGAYDKVPLKFEGWGENRFREAGFRVVPGAIAGLRPATHRVRRRRRRAHRTAHGNSRSG